MASSPSEINITTSSEFISEAAYIIIFSLGFLVVILTVILACFFGRNHVLAPTNFNQPRTSPIAAPNPSLQSSNESSLVGLEQGLDEGLLSTYPKLLYSQVKLQHGNLTPCSCCSICLADYKDDDILLLLPYCAHFYHVQCGFQWLQLHPTCPMCRKLASPVSIPVSQLAHQLPIPEDGTEMQNF